MLFRTQKLFPRFGQCRQFLNESQRTAHTFEERTIFLPREEIPIEKSALLERGETGKRVSDAADRLP